MTSVDDTRSMAPAMDVAPTFSALWGASPAKGAFCFRLQMQGSGAKKRAKQKEKREL